jgi:hypothetical protein
MSFRFRTACGPGRRGIVLAASLILLVSPALAGETDWLKALAASLEKARASGQVLDTSRLGTGSRAPVLSAKTQVPGVYDGVQSAWSAVPRVGLSVASPGSASSERFSWELAAGGEAYLHKDSQYDPITLFLSPYVTAQTTIRLAPAARGSLPPGEVLRNIELAGRVRGLEEKALSSFLEACSLAALSASSRADALKAKARSDYLEKNLRRMEIMMQGGKISRGDYLDEKDAFDREQSTASDAFYESGRLGREARALARPVSQAGTADGASGPVAVPAKEEPAYFQGPDLESLARMLEPLLESSDPAPLAVQTATAGWDLRLAELAAEEVAKAPAISASLDAKLGWNDSGKQVAPVVSGILGFVLPLGGERAARTKNMAQLRELRNSVAVDAEEAARRLLAEYRILLRNRRDRIEFLSGQYKEKLRLSEVYRKLEDQNVVTEIDRLAAVSAMVEVGSALDRARAGYFLDSVTALVNLKIPIGSFADIISKNEGKPQ